MDADGYVRFLTAAMAAVSFGVGIWLLIKQRKGPSVAFAAMLTCLLLFHIQKFKHIKGLGFDAETWNDKQQEAANIVDQFKRMSVLSLTQTARLSAFIASFHTKLSTQQLLEQLFQSREMLKSLGISDAEAGKILIPVQLSIILSAKIDQQDLIKSAMDENHWTDLLNKLNMINFNDNHSFYKLVTSDSRLSSDKNLIDKVKALDDLITEMESYRI